MRYIKFVDDFDGCKHQYNINMLVELFDCSRLITIKVHNTLYSYIYRAGTLEYCNNIDTLEIEPLNIIGTAATKIPMHKYIEYRFKKK